MSLKRPLSPVSLPPAKRQSIEAWLGTAANPYQSIEVQGEDSGEFVQEHRKSASSDMTSTLGAGPSDNGSTDKSLNYAASNYPALLKDRLIYYAKPWEAPSNFDQLVRMLGQDRTTPEPGQAEFWDVLCMIDTFQTEAGFFTYIASHLTKPNLDLIRDMQTRFSWAKNISIQTNLHWKDYVPIAPEKTPTLAAPMPDVTFGWATDTYPMNENPLVWNEPEPKPKKSGKKRRFDCVQDNSMMWPVLTIEAKKGGDVRLAEMQNAHNGAVMLNNIRELYRRVGTPFPYGEALVMSITVATETMKVVCHWIANEDQRDVFYYKTLNTWLLRPGNATGFAEGRRAIRNCIEYVLEQRFKSISELLELYKKQRLEQLEQRTTLPTAASSERGRRPSQPSNDSTADTSAATSQQTSRTTSSGADAGRSDSDTRRRKQSSSMDLTGDLIWSERELKRRESAGQFADQGSIDKDEDELGGGWRHDDEPRLG